VKVYFMQSNGGLAEARSFQGKDAILSGPAGGIVGAARTAAMAGIERIIGFDMGGTSTDVSHYAGEYEREFETRVAGVRMRAPMMSIHTVAAGGGSILHFDGARLRVGPDSAGANPGPACYRRGGPLAVTDANVMLGRVQPAFFPRVLGRMPTSRWTATWWWRGSRRSPLRSSAPPARARRPRRLRPALSRSPSATWPRRSSASRCSAVTMSPSTP
jgi:N-methylhydantoinase A/oxoprolinase/acetone carboxylase beta subunit